METPKQWRKLCYLCVFLNVVQCIELRVQETQHQLPTTREEALPDDYGSRVYYQRMGHQLGFENKISDTWKEAVWDPWNDIADPELKESFKEMKARLDKAGRGAGKGDINNRLADIENGDCSGLTDDQVERYAEFVDRLKKPAFIRRDKNNIINSIRQCDVYVAAIHKTSKVILSFLAVTLFRPEKKSGACDIIADISLSVSRWYGVTAMMFNQAREDLVHRSKYPDVFTFHTYMGNYPGIIRWSKIWHVPKIGKHMGFVRSMTNSFTTMFAADAVDEVFDETHKCWTEVIDYFKLARDGEYRPHMSTMKAKMVLNRNKELQTFCEWRCEEAGGQEDNKYCANKGNDVKRQLTRLLAPNNNVQHSEEADYFIGTKEDFAYALAQAVSTKSSTKIIEEKREQEAMAAGNTSPFR